jgi:hypothetical protein
VARDTIEEKILLLQQSKWALAEAILSEESSILRQLTTEDPDLRLSSSRHGRVRWLPKEWKMVLRAVE